MILCANPQAQFKTYEADILEAVKTVFASNHYVIGPAVIEFEKAFAGYCGTTHAIGVNSGTDALILTLRAMGIGKGDEVITVSHTALATVSAVIASGATPVLVDIDPELYTVDASGIESMITANTKAIIAVHLYGQLADVDTIQAIAKKHKLFLIEDCAQSTGAFYKGKRAGSIGDAGCFSFYPTKNLGAIGDGGMVVTSNAQLAERIDRLRQYGWDKDRRTEEVGINSRLDELQAAILNVKLKGLDADNRRRREIAAKYAQGLQGLNLVIPAERADTEHVYHLYVIKVADRDSLKKALADKQVFAGIHYLKPGHLHGGYSDICRLPSGGLPVTEKLVADIISLPMYPELTDAEVQQVIDAVREALS